MKCPKCGEDLIHLSGRYLCSDCGNEVPEAEVSVGGWNFSDNNQDKGEIPGSVQVNNFEDAIIDDGDYLVDYKTDAPENNESPEIEPEVKEDVVENDLTNPDSIELSDKEEMSSPTTKTTEDATKGYYTAEDLDTFDTPAEAIPINVVSSDTPTEPKLEEVDAAQTTVSDQPIVESVTVNIGEPKTNPEDILDEDLLSDQNSQAPVTIAPIDEELLRSPVMDDQVMEDNQQKVKSNSSKTNWLKWVFVATSIVCVLGILGYLVFDYLKTDNKGSSHEIQNPASTSWVDYKSTENNFGILVPVRPSSAKSVFAVGDQDLNVTLFESRENNDVLYKIHVIELSESMSKLENDDLMTLIAESFVKKDNLTLGFQEEISVDMAFGLDIEASNDNKILKARLIKVGDKIFVLSLTYNNNIDTAKYYDFVRSFKIIQEDI